MNSDRHHSISESKRNILLRSIVEKYSNMRPTTTFGTYRSEQRLSKYKENRAKSGTSSRFYSDSKGNLGVSDSRNSFYNINNISRQSHPALPDLSNKNDSDRRRIDRPDCRASIANEALFERNLKYLVTSHNLIKVRDLFRPHKDMKSETVHSQDLGFEKYEAIVIRDDERAKFAKDRFKKIVKLIFVILKLLKIHKVSIERVQNFHLQQEFSKPSNYKKDTFDTEQFSQPKEPPLSEETKRMLRLKPYERTEEIIRLIMISLNFSIPEFSEYPLYMQKMISSCAFYEEFEPGRVVIRQGHQAQNYYLIVSGSALVIVAEQKSSAEDIVYTPISCLKRGDGFGEYAFINNTKRTSTISAHGNKPLCLLAMDKEDFFRIQTPLKSNASKLEFLKKKCDILNSVKFPFDALDTLNSSNNAYFSIYYRSGSIICENSQTDEWLYVIKSGSCKVVKKIKFDQQAITKYSRSLKSARTSNLDRLRRLYALDKPSRYLSDDKKLLISEGARLKNFSLEKEDSKEKYTYLEMNKLKEGEIFGLQDIILPEEYQNSSLMLVSEGIECILINRNIFLKIIDSQALIQLRFLVSPYLDETYFTNKYFHSFKWKEFTSECNKDSISRKSRIKSSFR